MSDVGAAFTENLNRLSRFFTREGEFGYTFAVASDERLIPEVNQHLQGKARKAGRQTALLDLASPQADGLMQRLRSAAEGSNGLLVTGLSTWLRAAPEHLLELNFSRESLERLGIPLLLWIDEENLRKLTRQAADLYSRRRTATLFFDRPLDLPSIDTQLQTRFNDSFKSSQDYQRHQYRLALLQAQYQEAQEQNYPRLLTEYLLPLAEAYSQLDLHQEAMRLLQPQLQALMQQEDPEVLILLGDILYAARQYTEAEASYQAARPLLGQQANDRLSYLLLQLGDLNKETGRFPRAETYFQEAFTLNQARLEQDPTSEVIKNDLAQTFSRMGDIFQEMGKIEQALDFFQKRAQLGEELFQANPQSESLKNGLAISYSKLGSIFQALGKFEQALDFFQKYNQLSEELFQANPQSYQLINGLAISYYKLGSLCREMGKVEAARSYFEQAQEIWQQLHAATGIPQLAEYLELVEGDLAGLGALPTPYEGLEPS